MSAVSGGRLPQHTRLLYGLGSVAFGVKDSGFNYFLLLFYNQVLGLPAATVGAAIMVALMVDALLDPVIGQVSDNWRSRWGRRHPLMYAAAVPAALSFLLLWNPPAWSGAALVGWLVGVSILIRSFISLYEIPSAALVAELTTDYDERTRLLSYRYLFGWLGGVGVAVLALQVFLRPEVAGGAGQLNRAGYSHYGLAAAAVMFSAIVISAAGTHGRIPLLRQPPERPGGIGVWLSEMAATLANRAFVRVLAAALFSAMATGLVLSSALYLNTYFWELSSGQVAVFTGVSVGSACIAFAAATPLSRRIGKRRAAMAVLVGAPCFAAAPIALRLLGLAPANGDPRVFPMVLAAHLGATACAISAAILISSMTADVVEDSELRTGRRSEGLFFAATAFVAKAVSGVGIFASSMLLWAVGFPAGARPGQVEPRVIADLGLTYVPILAMLYLASAACVFSYRITRESHGDILARLDGQPDAKG